MDLCAEMLLAHLPDKATSAALLRPHFRRAATRVSLLPRRLARNADRLLNRFRHFPRFLNQRPAAFDRFPVVDHTYSQLVHVFPPGRAGVSCHAPAASRCLLAPQRAPRPRWFRALARRILTGLQKAAVV